MGSGLPQRNADMLMVVLNRIITSALLRQRASLAKEARGLPVPQPPDVWPAAQASKSAQKAKHALGKARRCAWDQATCQELCAAVGGVAANVPEWKGLLDSLLDGLGAPVAVALPTVAGDGRSNSADAPETPPHPTHLAVARARPSNSPGGPKTRPHGAHLAVPSERPSHQLGDLDAASQWNVFVDETGDAFGDPKRGKKQQMGRVVAVAVPEPRPEGLALLPTDWHACRFEDDERDSSLDGLLAFPVGILGLTSADVGGGQDGWATLIQRTVLLTAAALPVSHDGPPATIAFYVEQRGETLPSLQTLGIASIQTVLVSIDPAYAKVSMTLKVIAKGKNVDLGYPDLVAHTWAAASRESATRLKRSSLRGTCLHSANVFSAPLWDLAFASSHEPGAAWLEALARQRTNWNGLDRLLLGLVRRRVCNNAALWQQLLAGLGTYSDSKAVDSGVFSDACRFLGDSRPSGMVLPPQVELGFLLAQVAQGNHVGATSDEGLAALQALAKRRRGSNIQLSCEADLVCAVRHTNAFRFHDAETMLEGWEQDLPGLPLQWRGRWHSQRGQVHAFRGEHAAARDSFACALRLFDQLDEPERSRERAHSGTYAMIAATDDTTLSAAALRDIIDAGAGLVPMALAPQSLARIAASTGPSTQYVHHAVVRYLATRGETSDVGHYLSERARWATRSHHPWPLIDAWRFILLSKVGRQAFRDAGPILDRAIETCRKAGHEGVLGLIAETLAGVRKLTRLGAGPDPARLDELARSLPTAEARIALLRDLTGGAASTPQALLEAVLPFNFR
ncbi:MAG: hypothetical protein H6725_12325 [Sandaracinaceae bacterium]|nr:hypothetical protein [Sandaracinaceae bacterium]